MLRIIRIAVAPIVFFAKTDFVVASNGGDVGGSGQGSDPPGSSELGYSQGGHEDSGHDRVRLFSGNPGSRGHSVSAECIGMRS